MNPITWLSPATKFRAPFEFSHQKALQVPSLVQSRIRELAPRGRHIVTILGLLFGAAILGSPGVRASDLRVGLIGLDTSHVTAFTRIFNNPADAGHVPGARVVAAFKGGSPDVVASATRVDGFTKELVEKYGVKLYDSIEELARNVDAIMIESVDGRVHLDQARRVFPAGKPVFIDKPVAGSLRDAIEIYRLARQHNVPVFSVSPFRFSPVVGEVRRADIGKPLGVFSYGPATLEPHHPDLFWYGVHATETLFTVMGRGCESVTRTHTSDTDVVTGVWNDGRVGIFRGARGAKAEYGVVAFGSTAIAEGKPRVSYPDLLSAVVTFFKTGIPPVSAADTLEIFAFMEAADESKRRGGVPVTIAEVMKANGGSMDLLK